MDFIERIFGIAPDGGSGFLELILFLLPIAGLVWLGIARRLLTKWMQKGAVRFAKSSDDVNH